MINTNNNHDDHQIIPKKSIEIKQNDKFFTKIMSKETSIANSSTRVYYGGASSSIPFLWESQPGTPKDALLFSDTSLPPLTPPPSYQSSTPKSSKSENNIISPHKNKNFKTTLLATIFPRQLLASKKKTTRMSPSSSMSSSSTSSSSSNWSSSLQYSSSPSTFRRRRSFPYIKSPVRCYRGEDDEDGHDLGRSSPTSILCCGVNKDPGLRRVLANLACGAEKLEALSFAQRFGQDVGQTYSRFSQPLTNLSPGPCCFFWAFDALCLLGESFFQHDYKTSEV